MEGSDVQILPFGPVRADVVESAQIVFYYIGEAILHCHPRLFFKHRGMEKRFEGLKPDLGVLLAERVSGVDSVAHSLAFCQAVEAAMAKLPHRQREAIVLCHYQELGNIEAAELMGISVEALESLLSRARRSLRATLAPVAQGL